MKKRSILPLTAAVGCGFFLPADFSQASLVIASTATNGSTAFNASYAIGNAVDGKAADYASLNQGSDTYLEFGFSGAQTVNKVVVINRDSPAANDWIANFTMTFDGGLTAAVARTAARGVSGLHSLGGNFTTGTARLDVDTTGGGITGGNTGVMEVIFLNTSADRMLISGVTVANSAPAFDPTYAAANSLDSLIGRSLGGGQKPEYASAGLGNNAFLDFDLGSVRPVGGFDFFDRPAEADRVTAFDMIFSQDNVFGNGDDVVRSYANSGFAVGDEFASVQARFVRFDVTASNGLNTGASEFYFYQTVPEPTSSLAALLGAGGILLRRRRRMA